MKNILIAGAHSYIGDSFKEYIEKYTGQYSVKILPTRNLIPSSDMFDGIDVVFCVAGIAHRKETKENRHLYFAVNRDLVVKIAKAAKVAGVKQFILLSSMSVYGLNTGYITKSTIPNPKTAYGESKLQADEEIKKMEDKGFGFACLRPPMVYGKNCTGNYQKLRSFALNSTMFPDYENQRSMIYIGNLCEFVRDIIDSERRGLFFPQNTEYVSTSAMVKLIAKENGRKIRLTKVFNALINITPLNVISKVFGNLTYEKCDAIEKYGFAESLKLTEKK